MTIFIDDMSKEYYKILNVPDTASQDDIKSSFRELAKKYHPDIHSDKEESVKKEMEEKFKELNQAYEVLSDVQSRAVYDAGGNTNKRHNNPSPNDIESFLRQHFGNMSGAGFNFNGMFTQQQIFSVETEISYYQMICGGDIEIDNTPVGKVKLTIPAGAFPGAQFKVKIKKEANSEIFLQVTLKLKIPTSLSEEQKEKIKELGI